MCTLLFAWRVFDDVPLVVATNRDEVLDRPASPPAVLDVVPKTIAPKDERAGGTWIGYNEHGVFVAITNRSSTLEGERSRGRLVVDALESGSAEAAKELVERELAARRYAGFNLVLCDSRAAWLLEWDGELRTHAFDPGVHVVVNAGREGQADKASAIHDRIQPAPGSTAADWLEAAATVLRNHEMGVCVHGEGFGTRSSSLITVNRDGRIRYRFSDGPTCRSTYRTYHDGPL